MIRRELEGKAIFRSFLLQKFFHEYINQSKQQKKHLLVSSRGICWSRNCSSIRLIDFLRKLLQILEELIDVHFERIDNLFRLGFDSLAAFLGNLERKRVRKRKGEKSRGEKQKQKTRRKRKVSREVEEKREGK